MADLDDLNPDDVPAVHEDDDQVVPDPDPDAVANEDEDRDANDSDDEIGTVPPLTPRIAGS